MRPIRTWVLNGRVSVFQTNLDRIIGIQLAELFDTEDKDDHETSLSSWDTFDRILRDLKQYFSSKILFIHS